MTQTPFPSIVLTEIFSRRQRGVGRLIIWNRFSVAFKTNIEIIDGNQESDDYIETLGNELEPLVEN